MEERGIVLMILGVVLLVAVAGLVITLTASTTGMYMVYPPLPLEGGIVNMPDPDTQYMVVDEGVCTLARKSPSTFLSFVQRQCRTMNPGRAKREGDCHYKAMLDAQLYCFSAPVFQTMQQPQFLV
ncbi:MAG: hypothetical protein QXT19_02220 [Candidatus Woesearchaeota archaeon]